MGEKNRIPEFESSRHRATRNKRGRGRRPRRDEGSEKPLQKAEKLATGQRKGVYSMHLRDLGKRVARPSLIQRKRKPRAKNHTHFKRETKTSRRWVIVRGREIEEKMPYTEARKSGKGRDYHRAGLWRSAVQYDSLGEDNRRQLLISTEKARGVRL